MAGGKLADGSHTLHVQATDGAGNVSGTFDVLFTLDTSTKTAPTVTAALLHDTGTSDSDGITSDSTVGGTITDAKAIASFKAGFDATLAANFVDVRRPCRRTGRSCSTPLAGPVAGGKLADGATCCTCRPRMRTRTPPAWSTLPSPWTPAEPRLSFDLDPGFDSLPVGDHQTNFAVVSLVGQAGRGASVDLQGTTQHTTADATTGQFRLDSVALAMGPNVLTVVAQGTGGNQSTFSLTITRTSNNPPTLQPVGTLTVMAGHVLPVRLSASDPDGDPLAFSLNTAAAWRVTARRQADCRRHADIRTPAEPSRHLPVRRGGQRRAETRGAAGDAEGRGRSGDDDAGVGRGAGHQRTASGGDPRQRRRRAGERGPTDLSGWTSAPACRRRRHW